ncbi:hypothetical protein ACQPZQ_21740 [Pseudonocardia sp. CA-142604]|uniref:hypothetical protein n=1 Tax=Pseudonocardia sp. CA-142604 TaxID=3240024 RepID=UPI003D8B5671
MADDPKGMGVHAGYVDPELVSHIRGPGISAKSVADQTMQAILNDRPEVLVDETTRCVKATCRHIVQSVDPVGAATRQPFDAPDRPRDDVRHSSFIASPSPPLN